jgi:hypothetical protein
MNIASFILLAIGVTLTVLFSAITGVAENKIIEEALIPIRIVRYEVLNCG